MDKLQKMASWLWLYKERIIFVVMVLVLGQRVWLVFNPETINRPIERVPNSPGVAIPAEGMPPEMPSAPPVYTPDSYPDLRRANPFWVHAGSGSGSSSAVDAPDISVLSIMTGSTPRARIRDASGSRDFYRVNDTVDGYTIEEIDGEAETVTLVNDATGERLTLERS